MKFEYEIPKDSMDKLHKLFDHSFEKMKEAKIRFEKGVETEEDLLKYYPNFRLKYEDKNKVKELDVVELRYYEKLVEITNRKNELIKEISKYLVSIRDCPAEDFGVKIIVLLKMN